MRTTSAVEAPKGSQGPTLAPPSWGRLKRALPTEELGWDEFEDFTERVLSGHRFCPTPVVHVTRVERWGRRGDKQDGIDFEGEFSDGRTAAWQCKHQRALPPADVTAAVRACTFTADRYFLVFAGEASAMARAEMRKHRDWDLLDRRGLARMLDDMPLFKRRAILDDTWGPKRRRLLLDVPAEDAFISTDVVRAGRQDPHRVLNDLRPRIGREAELADLHTALSASATLGVVLVVGPGGRGKTRVIVEAVTQFQAEHMNVPVLWLARGRTVDQDALSELPHTPAVIVVDDVHDMVDALDALINYARQVPGTRLLLATRPSGVDAVRDAALRFDVPSRQIVRIDLDELPLRAAREMVESLVDGLGLAFGVREYLAQQAIHSPYVAVVAANLIRAKALAAPLVVDPGFREEILRRYGTQATANLDSTDRRAVQQLLATYAALGPIQQGNLEIRTRLAAFCKIENHDLLVLQQALQGRGVLIEQSEFLRLVPDVLADHFLEETAAVGGSDTGFVARLWRAFGADHGLRLVVALSELDWRLTRRGGPSVFAPVWDDVLAELRGTDSRGLRMALSRLQELAHTQPRPMIELLEEIRDRFAPGDAAGQSGQEGPWNSAATALPRVPRTQGATDSDGLIALLAPLYGECAAADPSLLERAVDALWDLCRRDAREPRQNTDHPQSVLADQLANLRALPDPSFPSRIVARVRAWLQEPGNARDVATPLFALAPLLAKEGSYFVTRTRMSLSGESYLISPSWARPFRDEIRQLLRGLAAGENLRLAGESVDLLGEALQAVHGYFNATVDPARVTEWAEDDVETVAALRHAAKSTSSASLRRYIREQVSWHAFRARSLAVRHAALDLVTELDNRAEDDVAEVMLNAWGVHDPSRRGVPLPDLKTLEAEVAEREAADGSRSQAERDAARQQALRAGVEVMRAHSQLRTGRVVKDLLRLDDAAAIIAVLDNTAAEVSAVQRNPAPGVDVLLREIADAVPELAGPLTRLISDMPGSALDPGLYRLIAAWVAHSEKEASAWLAQPSTRRQPVRLAIGIAFLHHSLATQIDALAAVHADGMNDPDQAVRDTFLMAAHSSLTVRPAVTVAMLLQAGISPRAAGEALSLAADHDCLPWGATLEAEDAEAVLKLVDHIGWDDWNAQRATCGIASSHPRLVLDHLLVMQRANALPYQVDGLGEALAQHGAALVSWLGTHREDAFPISMVLSVVLGAGLTPTLAGDLAAYAELLEQPDLVGLTVMLGGIELWPLRQPELARLVLQRSSGQGSAMLHTELRDRLLAAMQPTRIGFTNGRSDELELALAATVVKEESDDELRGLIEQADAAIRTRMELRKEHELEEEGF